MLLNYLYEVKFRLILWYSHNWKLFFNV